MDALIGVQRIAKVGAGLWPIVTAALILMIFISEFLSPRGFAHGLLYTIPLIGSVLTLNARVVALATLASAILCLVGYYIPWAERTPEFAIANRVLSALVLCVIGALATRITHYIKTLTEARDAVLARSEELNRAQHLLSVAGRLAKVGGWSVDVPSRRLEWSEEVAAVLRLPSGVSLTVEEALDLFTPESREAAARLLMNCMAMGTPYDEEFELLCSSGDKTWVRIIAEAVRDQRSAVVRVQGALQDVTETRALEKRLAESRSRFHQLIDAMPMLVWTAGPSGEMAYSSKSLYDFIGSPSDVERDLDWFTFLHPEEAGKFANQWRSSVSSGKRFYAEARLRHSEGEYRWHLFTAAPVRDEMERIVGWFGSATDIEDSKKAEELVRDLSERLFSTLENISDAFFIVNTEWRFTYANSEFRSWIGSKGENIIGRSIWDEFPHGIDTPLYPEFQRAVRERCSVKLVQYLPYIDRWVSVHAYPSAEGLSVYLQDITQQRRLDERLRQSQGLETLGQLAGGIAHDFNNLLTIIVGNAEVLAESLSDDERMSSLASLTLEAAERGAELVSRLLSFSRRQRLRPARIDVVDLIAGLAKLLRRTIGAHIEIQTICEPGVWAALGDETQVECAMVNLCINARDAMKGGGCLTIEAANAHVDPDFDAVDGDVAPGDYVVLSVSDDGEGMTKESLARAFEPFFTTKSFGEGHGLGLSMVYGLAKQSNGHVQIESELGFGTTVRLYLPRATASQSRTAGLEEARSLPKGTERILLVEDDPLVRKHVHARLRQLGYNVTAASSGLEALEVLEVDCSFDLLFTDIVMPGPLDGHDLADRAQELCPGIRVLLTTGYSDNTRLQLDGAEADIQLLRKPYKREALAVALRQLLDK